ncbi:MAG: response regulator [Drouetiella hepatica Uher 2000/2452]|jgi:signal transduction histidine kinase|uniref:histidine kinase n=1 Tax=Drouetiella hepatica Uher 2000/2452 TaxID=904376 RepID=A0A951QEA8_9CYAN|nr:response regulator [Drouetiella hepatica Uher 2000/2452]
MKTILVIEDEQMIRESISDLLQIEGFGVMNADLGTKGIQMAQEYLPDLILCDVNMPDVDGYHVLSTLQQNPIVKTIPFIFLTARGTKTDLRHGMNLGADDYLVKPCTAEELLEAIASRFARHDLFRTQSQQQLEALRNNIALFLPHELHTPLNGILLFSEILMGEYESISRSEILEIAEGIHSSADRLYRLIQNFLCYAQLEIAAHDPDRRAVLCAGETFGGEAQIAEIAARLALQADRSADLSLKLQKANLRMSGTRLQKTMEELIGNAFKFSQPGTVVEISSYLTEQNFVVQIADSGRGMTSEQIASLGAYMQFDRRFYEQQGSGLGLIIAKRMLELHGGGLAIESAVGQQTTVQATIPLAVNDER